MKKLIIISLLLLLTSCAHTQPWDNEERAYMLAIAGGQAVSWSQVNEGNSEEGIYEQNPIYANQSPETVALIKIGAVTGIGIVADLLPEDGYWLTRKRFLRGCVAITGFFIIKDQMVIEDN